MGLLSFKNQFGAMGQGVDQQRSDLFYVLIPFPSLLKEAQGSSLWDSEVAFAVQEFPFPERTRETMPVKYLQQTNHQIGADTASGSVDMVVRYAFNKRTAELLERWHWLIANPRNGGVGLSSACKVDGHFFWLTPNMEKLANIDDVSQTGVMTLGARYKLEGCWVRGLKPSTADMTQSNQGVTLTFSLQVDRYYPERVTDLNGANFTSNIASLGLSNALANIRT